MLNRYDLVLSENNIEKESQLFADGKTEGVYTLRLLVDGSRETISVSSRIDWEASAMKLKKELDARGMMLHCNRYHPQAFVSGMSRSMSEGLSCYRKRLFRKPKIVGSFESSLEG